MAPIPAGARTVAFAPVTAKFFRMTILTPQPSQARGMARYTESHENGRAFIADGMEVKAKAAIPMSAMWTSQANRPSSPFDADIRESASVSHIYGQNLVADIAYYYGEDSNVTALFQGNPPPIPAGYNFDYVNSDVVRNIAEVTVNGKALGTCWKAPFRVDVTSALKPGANTLEIKVINLWVNRLIGDQQEGVTTKYTYTAQQFYRADSPLLPSGLIGPVQVIRSATK